MKEKIITIKEYLRAFNCQKYFIWNNDVNDFINKYCVDNKNDDAIFKILKNNEEEINEENEKDFDFQKIFSSSYIINENISNTPVVLFSKLEDEAVDFAKNKIFENCNIGIISNKDNNESKKIQTKRMLNDNSIDVILNPIFSYTTKNEFEVVAKLFAYDKRYKTIYLFQPKSGTNFDNLLSLNFCYYVLKENNIEVKNAFYLIINNEMPTKAQRTNFIISKCNYMNKNKYKVNKDVEINKKIQAFGINLQSFFNTSHQYDFSILKKYQEEYKIPIKIQDSIANFMETNSINYINAIRGGYGFFNMKFEEKDNKFTYCIYKERSNKKANSLHINDDGTLTVYQNPKYLIPDFASSISWIEEAYNVNSPDLQWKNSSFHCKEIFGSKDEYKKNYKLFLLKDYPFSKSPKINAIVNGTFVDNENWESKKNKYIEFCTRAYETDDYFSDIFITKHLSLMNIKNEKIVWYDYESLMSPDVVIDCTTPYSQIINQVSIVTTINDEIIDKDREDIVIDPLKITFFDIANIIKILYEKKGQKYVVFNKGFENSRNKEIGEIANRLSQFDNEFTKKLQEKLNITLSELHNMINYINTNTIDLAEYFYPPSTDDNQCNNILIKMNKEQKFYKKRELIPSKINEIPFYWNALQGYYSIKKIEKEITKNDLPEAKIIKPYSSLEKIRNGANAMAASISRYAGLIGNLEWENITKNLKIYCHNDVMAMIMAYKFVIRKVEEVFPNFKEIKSALDNNQKYNINYETWEIVIENK